MRLLIKIAAVAQLILFLLLSGCGKWPPIVENSDDIRGLSSDEPSVRARGLSDDDIYALEHLKKLTYLDFSGEWAVKEAKITDKGLKILSELYLPMIETLSLGNNKNITDNGLKYHVKMKSVKWLSLMVCPNITDDGLRNLSIMSTLDALDLRGCNGITNSGLKYLSEMKNVKEILLGGCKNITPNAVKKLQLKIPNAKVEKDEKEWSGHKK